MHSVVLHSKWGIPQVCQVYPIVCLKQYTAYSVSHEGAFNNHSFEWSRIRVSTTVVIVTVVVSLWHCSTKLMDLMHCRYNWAFTGTFKIFSAQHALTLAVTLLTVINLMESHLLKQRLLVNCHWTDVFYGHVVERNHFNLALAWGLLWLAMFRVCNTLCLQ